jgi:hypothetical protein
MGDGAMKNVLRAAKVGLYVFHCPGCGINHCVYTDGFPQAGPRWQFNGDLSKPTFNPSLLVRWSEPSDNPSEFDNQEKDKHFICHSFVKDGRIQFLSDSTHALAGQTVDIAPWDVDDEN